jgi:DNA polymerase III subunit gamma/tau
LKTLEEPPPYAIFILATTEKHKILPTILSRCQIFDFKRITLQDTVDHLEGIANKEHIKAEETALQLISQKSEGCMRDALSILDKIVSFTNGEVTYENTIEHLNILDADYYFKLVDCMLNQDLAGAMLLYDDIDKKGFEGDMVLNGFAEFIRNLLICKDERVAGLLEVVESFRQRYAQTAKRTDTGYLVSALNILNEAEISFRSARNKRLHVELALIKLCYLQQAIELTSNGSALDKKKVVEGPKSIAFRNITPLAQGMAPNGTNPTSPKVKKTEAKLIIDTPSPALPILIVEEKKEVYKAPPGAVRPTEIPTPAASPANGKKISSLHALRQKIGNGSGMDVIADKPLNDQSLKEAWDQFIINLKSSKNPAWQSFETAMLNIKDNNSFEAIVTNNINQKFLELERNKACEFLQAALQNRQLQFIIVLQEGVIEHIETDRPLSSKEQYQKIIEQFPLVKELRERLRLELDY